MLLVAATALNKQTALYLVYAAELFVPALNRHNFLILCVEAAPTDDMAAVKTAATPMLLRLRPMG